MPSQSTLTADEKAKIKNVISDKTIYATLARIYYAYPQPDKWSYTGLQGALAFTLDNSTNTYHFKLIDTEGTRGILWEHELYKNLEYNSERNFFHSFEGDVSGVQPPIPTLNLTDFIEMYDRIHLCR